MSQEEMKQQVEEAAPTGKRGSQRCLGCLGRWYDRGGEDIADCPTKVGLQADFDKPGLQTYQRHKYHAEGVCSATGEASS